MNGSHSCHGYGFNGVINIGDRSYGYPIESLRAVHATYGGINNVKPTIIIEYSWYGTTVMGVIDSDIELRILPVVAHQSVIQVTIVRTMYGTSQATTRLQKYSRLDTETSTARRARQQPSAGSRYSCRTLQVKAWRGSSARAATAMDPMQH